MSPDRHRRRFRRPGTGNWLTEQLPVLRLELAPAVRATLTTWMRLYGEANHLPGLATGSIETRFARLREHANARSLIVWTTPERWAGGEGLSLRLPDLHLEFGCALAEGHLSAARVMQVTDEARAPDREMGAVGVTLDVDLVTLPPEHGNGESEDPGVALLEMHFARLAGQRWGGFVEPLRMALEAEALEDEVRTQRLTVPYNSGALLHGGDEEAWKLAGVPAEVLHQLDDGEWLELHDRHGRSSSAARVIRTRPGEGTLEVGVRGSADPPAEGVLRPRSRRKILDQKRAVLDELESPTGSLPHLVRLVAAPSSLPVPRAVRPTRFVNPVVPRNRGQARAVALALGLEEGQALMIQGPPGTGKSTTAAEIDVQLILRDPGVRILVCSHSNHGTDNMLMKVLPFLEDAQERIARVGYYDRVAREARPFYAAPDADLGDRNVIFTTIDALALQDVVGATVYDYVILDEANRAGVLDSLLALARGKRMILVGDAMQLQPVLSEAEQRLVAASRGGAGRLGGREGVPMAPAPGPRNVIGKSLFAWLLERRFAPPAVVLLDQQNRMHPSIGDLVSRVFYGGQVRTGPAAPRRGTGIPLFSSPVTWVDTRSLRGNAEMRVRGASLINVAEGRLVASATRYVAAHAPPQMNIGVIAAYSEQRELLRRMIGPRDQFPAERQLEIDTVDAFEGREKDIIILSLVRANRRREVGFLNVEQRLNVAVSRARRLILVVGDTSTLRGGHLQQLIVTAGQLGQIVSAPRLLSHLAGNGAVPALGAGRPRDRVAPTARRKERPVPAAMVGAPGPAVESGVGQPTTPPLAPPVPGLPRRRRRAWERRRDRLLRATLALETLEGDGPAGLDPLPVGDTAQSMAPALAEPRGPAPETAETAGAGEPVRPEHRRLLPRQRRRARQRALREARLGQPTTTTEPAGSAAPADPGPLPRAAEPLVRRRRGRADGQLAPAVLEPAPMVSEPASVPEPPHLSQVPPAPGPARSRSARVPPPVAESASTPLPEPASAFPPAGPARARRPRPAKSASTPLPEPAPEPDSLVPPAGPARARRPRPAESASTPLPEPAPELAAPVAPARSARARKGGPAESASVPLPEPTVAVPLAHTLRAGKAAAEPGPSAGSAPSAAPALAKTARTRPVRAAPSPIEPAPTPPDPAPAALPRARKSGQSARAASAELAFSQPAAVQPPRKAASPAPKPASARTRRRPDHAADEAESD